eukprot:TRINITY_DN4942_c1_g2_i2.p1 TRINITY_DN4942_c1_g2~~TRINITY_DN4942_c1_g2_i2.p1  ORF type:complete len:439 (+),score=118.59 TRINITY_DN4942_c1_g2_i2:414-1730(+)
MELKRQDWDCKRCTLVNNGKKEYCECCNLKRENLFPQRRREESFEHLKEEEENDDRLIEGKNQLSWREHWNCDRCSFKNELDSSFCVMCLSDKVEIKSTTTIDNECPYCSITLTEKDAEEHVQLHLFEDEKKGRDNVGYFENFDRNLKKEMETGKISSACFHFRTNKMNKLKETGIDIIEFPDIFSSIQSSLSSISNNKRGNNFEWIWSGECCHFGSDEGDRGWGCGYRNIQILASHLILREPYSSSVFCGLKKIPTVDKIQEWMEAAWGAGYDTEGSSHFSNSILNSSKRIGATDAVALFRSFGIKAKVVDFFSARVENQSKKWKPNKEMLNWISNHFLSNKNKSTPPLYFQHEGHSRTIIGIRRNGEKSTLIVLDPSYSPYNLQNDLKQSKYNRLLVDLGSLTKEKYQIIYIEEGLMNERERKENLYIGSSQVFSL